MFIQLLSSRSGPHMFDCNKYFWMRLSWNVTNSAFLKQQGVPVLESRFPMKWSVWNRNQGMDLRMKIANELRVVFCNMKI
jgi:hypothetical protein